MRHTRLDLREGFHVLTGNARSQAATMVIAPGETVGGPDNRHAGSDQWLYLLSGEGEVTVDGDTRSIGKGDLLLIERGETHEIRNTGDGPLRTLNVYVPPAYSSDGERLRDQG